MRLFVDDQRIPPEGWEVTRTVTDGIRFLASNPVDVLSLDHDIANSHAPFQIFSQENFSTIAQYVTLMKNPPKIIFLHTASRFGCQNMKDILSKTKSKVVRVSPIGYQEEIEEFLKKWRG